MIEKALIILIFMYSVSFAVLAGQFIIADVFGKTLTNYNGDEIKSNLVSIIDIDTINSISNSIVTGNYTISDTATAFVAAGNVVVELLLLLTGTYIFNVLWLFGVPELIIVGMVILYIILLGRAIIAYIRGI